MTGGRNTHRAALVVARCGALAAVLLAATAVALPLAGGLDYLDDLMGTPEVVIAVSFSATGAFLVRSEQASRIGWLLLAVGMCSALYTVSASYAAFTVGGDVTAPLPPGADLALAAAWVTMWAWFPSWLLVLTVLPQVVPYGRPLSPRWRPALWAPLLALAVGVVGLATGPGQAGVLEAEDNPLAIPALSAVFDPVGLFLDVFVPVLVIVALVTLVVRLRRADRTERRQLGWVGYTVGVAVVVIAFAPSVWVNLAVLLVPAGLAAAALRYRLYDLDLLINRTLVAVALLGAGALAYVALVTWAGALAGPGIGPFVAAVALALVFHSARVRVQRAVDRMFFGRRGDPLALIEDLDRTLREAATPPEALAGAVRVVRAGLRLPGVAVVVVLPSGEEVRAQDGTVPGTAALEVPLALHGEQVGRLLVASRTPGEPVHGSDQRALASLAGPLASAAYALRLSGDLEESRRRLLDTREEERRRLRRDLHDGLGPQLAGVVMGLDVVGSALSRGDAERAAELTRVVGAQAREAVADVRRLAHGLRPPVLDDLGLVGALRSAWPAAAPAGTTVEVQADGDLADLPAAVEVAAYRIAQEAVTNAVRHAAAARVVVRLRACDDAVTLEVQDDGAGLPADVTPGLGLASMRERAAEVGGWCSVGPAATGTLVTAHLPRRSP